MIAKVQKYFGISWLAALTPVLEHGKNPDQFLPSLKLRNCKQVVYCPSALQLTFNFFSPVRCNESPHVNFHFNRNQTLSPVIYRRKLFTLRESITQVVPSSPLPSFPQLKDV